MILLKFSRRGQILYAAYCHLSMIVVRHGAVSRGEMIGLTGNTGNARTMHGQDQHLHFEIRTTMASTPGLSNRVDPASLYGRAPIGWAFFEGHGQKAVGFGLGLKVPGVNLRERL